MLNSSSMEISRSLTSWQKGARSIIHRALQYLEGNLTVIEHFPDQTQTTHEQFGQDKPDAIHAVIEIKHPDFYSRVLKGGVLLPQKLTWKGGGKALI